MKRQILAVEFILMAIISTLTVSVLDVASANFFIDKGIYHGEPTLPAIDIQSPSEKITYWIESDVWLDFTIRVPRTAWYSVETKEFSHGSYGNMTEVTVSIGVSQQRQISAVSKHEGVDWYFSYSVNLGRLTAGQHTVTVTATGWGYDGVIDVEQNINLGSNYSIRDQLKTKTVSSSASISFSVDATRPSTLPNVTLLSPTNTTYYYIKDCPLTKDWTHIPYVRLTYQSEDTHLSVGYRFDADPYITPAINGTSISIPLHSRSLTFYANDTFGNAATSQTAYYNIARATDSMPPKNTPSVNSTSPWRRPALSNLNSTSHQDLNLNPRTQLPSLQITMAYIAPIAVILIIGLFAYHRRNKPK